MAASEYTLLLNQMPLVLSAITIDICLLTSADIYLKQIQKYLRWMYIFFFASSYNKLLQTMKQSQSHILFLILDFLWIKINVTTLEHIL